MQSHRQDRGERWHVRAGDTPVPMGQCAETRHPRASPHDQDHTAAGKELQQVAKSKNVTLPDELNADQKSTSTKLSALNGAAFDRAFIEQMVSDHQKAIELFTQGSAVNDQAVRDFASKTLPKLKQHLQQAQSLQQQIER